MNRIIFIVPLILGLVFTSFAQDAENYCPKIGLISPQSFLLANVTAEFSVEIEGKPDKTNFSYEWTISRGKIIQGQSTSKITVLTEKQDKGENLEVSVKIFGLNKTCNDTFSDVVAVEPELAIHDPVDTLGKPAPTIEGTFSHLARFDNFMILIIGAPESEGLVTISFNREDDRNYKISRLKKILGFFEKRKYDLKRVTFAITEFDYEEKTVMWIVPPQAEFPEYVDSSYKIIKGEDLKKSINNLFPLK